MNETTKYTECCQQGENLSKKSWYWRERNSSFGGYAGIFHTSFKIKKLIPKSKIYVEPLAGLARTAEPKHDMVILNDKSDFANEHNQKQHPYAKITHDDFRDCIKTWDSKDTFFLIDPPWFDREYKSNKNAFCDMKSREYYEAIFNLIQQLKGNFFVLSKNNNPPTKHWDYNKYTIESDKFVLFGKKAKTLITTNLVLDKLSLNKDSQPSSEAQS